VHRERTVGELTGRIRPYRPTQTISTATGVLHYAQDAAQRIRRCFSCLHGHGASTRDRFLLLAEDLDSDIVY